MILSEDAGPKDRGGGLMIDVLDATVKPVSGDDQLPYQLCITLAWYDSSERNVFLAVDSAEARTTLMLALERVAAAASAPELCDEWKLALPPVPKLEVPPTPQESGASRRFSFRQPTTSQPKPPPASSAITAADAAPQPSPSASTMSVTEVTSCLKAVAPVVPAATAVITAFTALHKLGKVCRHGPGIIAECRLLNCSAPYNLCPRCGICVLRSWVSCRNAPNITLSCSPSLADVTL